MTYSLDVPQASRLSSSTRHSCLVPENADWEPVRSFKLEHELLSHISLRKASDSRDTNHSENVQPDRIFVSGAEIL